MNETTTSKSPRPWDALAIILELAFWAFICINVRFCMNCYYTTSNDICAYSVGLILWFWFYIVVLIMRGYAVWRRRKWTVKPKLLMGGGFVAAIAVIFFTFMWMQYGWRRYDGEFQITSSSPVDILATHSVVFIAISGIIFAAMRLAGLSRRDIALVLLLPFVVIVAAPIRLTHVASRLTDRHIQEFVPYEAEEYHLSNKNTVRVVRYDGASAELLVYFCNEVGASTGSEIIFFSKKQHGWKAYKHEFIGDSNLLGNLCPSKTQRNHK